MASNIIPKLNLSLPPRRINGVPLNIFNYDTDFKNDDDVRYVNAEGDVMSGVLTVPSLVTNSGITLPTAYTTAPSTSQIVGISQRYTWVDVITTPYTTTSLRSFTVEQGNYLLFYRVAFNNFTGGNITIGIFQASVSTLANSLDEDYKSSIMAPQTLGNTFNCALTGCFPYQNISGTQKTLYLNYFTYTNNATVRGYVQVVRIG